MPAFPKYYVLPAAFACFSIGHSVAPAPDKQHAFLSLSLHQGTAEVRYVAEAAKDLSWRPIWNFFLGGFAFATGLCLLYNQGKADRDLAAMTGDSGAKVQATITKKRLGDASVVYVSYTFDTTRSDGVRCRVTAEQAWQNPATVFHVHVETEETVLYAPENPGLCYPERALLKEETINWRIWGVLFLVAGIIDFVFCSFESKVSLAILICSWLVCVGVFTVLEVSFIKNFIDKPPSSEGIVEELGTAN